MQNPKGGACLPLMLRYRLFMGNKSHYIGAALPEYQTDYCKFNRGRSTDSKQNIYIFTLITIE
jgi:hypothetical protein